MNETDLATAAATEMERTGWRVYHEVPFVIQGNEVTADLVGVKDAQTPTTVAVVECKMRLDQHLVAQATRWFHYCSFISVVVQEPKRLSDKHCDRRAFLKRNGVSLLYVPPSIEMIYPPDDTQPLNMHGDCRGLLAALHDDQRTIGPKGGTSAGKRVRPDKWDGVRAQLQGGPARAKELDFESKDERREFIKKAEKGRIRNVGILIGSTPYQFYLRET